MMGKTGLQLKALIKKGGAVGKDAQHEVNERTRSGVRGPDYSTSIKSHAGGNNRGTARIGTSESEFKARKAAEAVLARARKAGYGSIIPSMKDGPNSTNFL